MSRPSRPSTAKKNTSPENKFVPLAEVAPVKAKEFSKLGIASLVLSLVPLLLFILMTFVMLSMASQYTDPTALPSDEELMKMVAPVLIGMGAGFISVLLAFVFGVISVLQKQKSAAFGIAGLVVSSLWFFLFVVSAIMGNQAV